MAIPSNITIEHALKAMARIDKEGAPPRRNSTKYSVVHEGVKYPPKYVISVANEFANHDHLNPKGFNTYHAQLVLRSMKFDTVPPIG